MEPPGGFRVFPYAVSRYGQNPGEVYADGWVQLVLPALKTLNAEKRIFLKTGPRASDPVLLTNDDGMVNWNWKARFDQPGRGHCRRQAAGAAAAGRVGTRFPRK